MDTLAGKMLRINSNGTIPSDNPFYNTASGINRAIWATGLRNPFTFGVQPGTGRIFINDVGQATWEEINEGRAGANYGWPASEGPDNTAGFTAPIYWYGREDGCSIGGGVFYNPPNPSFPSEYEGKYFFVDLCEGWIRALDPDSFAASDFATGLVFPVDLDVGPDGSLYYLNRGTGLETGHIGRIEFASVGAPVILSQPQSQQVGPGSTVIFSVQATGEGDLSYRWQRNGVDLPGATGPTVTLENVQTGNAGQYRAVVTNSQGQATSNAATLTVISGNVPTAVIDTPTSGTTFRGGQTISFSGRGMDNEDGPLGADRMTWQVDYHTGSVVRPFFPATSGIESGRFTIPTSSPYKASDVFYRVRLTVTDSDGVSTTTTRDIQPVVSRITLRSNVPGITVFTDGETRNTPTSFNAVAGFRRTLSAEQFVNLDGTSYVFDGWSNGGDRTNDVSMPTTDTTYVARYREQPAVTTTKGLAQTIFNNRDRTGTMITRNVNTIDFDWGEGSPHPLIHPDTFFIRFRGKVQPEFSETYTFHTFADDGVRLFVNGQLLVNQWEDSDGSERSGSIDLEAGRKYDLRFDYFENTGGASARLEWSSASTPQQVIPRSKLFSTIMPQTLPPTADAFVQGGSAAATNFGNRDTLIVKSATDNRYQRDAYLKFDIRDLDVSSMGSAKLRVYGRLSGDADTNVRLGLYEAPGAKWGERSITWENRPDTRVKALGAAVVSNTRNQWWEFDITEFLRQQRAAGRTIVTFALRNLDNSSVVTVLAARDAATNGPQLVVSV
jgi:hypothetical protein